MELFKLFGSIFIDNDEANKSLANTEKKAEGMGSKLGKVAGGVAKGGAIMAGGLASAGTALLGVADKSAETADRVDKLSAKTGLSKQGFQEWDYIMGQNGMSIEKMQTGMKTLVSQMDGVAEGNKKSIEMFDSLGVSVKNSDGSLRSQEAVMNDTILALAEMPEGAEKARLATELFGKAGVDMAPMLATGAQGITDLKDRSHELGLVMSDEAVNSGVVFGDTMDDVKDSLGMVVTKVGIELMPVIMTFLEWVLANMPTIQSVFSTVMDAVSTDVKWAIDAFNLYLLPIIKTVYDWVQANMPTIQAVIGAVFDAVSAVVKTATDIFRDVLMPIFTSIYEWVQANWPSIRDTIVAVFDKIKTVWETVLKPALDALIGFIRDTLVPKIQELFPKIQTAVESVFNAIKSVWDNILKPVFDAVWNFIEDNLAPAFDTVFGGIQTAVETAFDAVGVAVDTVTGVFNGIKTVIDNVGSWFTGLKDGITNTINGARDAVGDAIDKIKGFFGFKFEWPKLSLPSFGLSPAGWKISDLLKGSIPKISINWNAQGGIFDQPTIFNTRAGLQGVGEAGAEAILPISKLQELVDWNSDRDLLMKILKVLEIMANKSTNILLDGETLVGATFDKMDQLSGFKSREQIIAYGG